MTSAMGGRRPGETPLTILDALRTRDPDLLNLRKASRAAAVAFPIFAVADHVMADGSLAAFAFFACFAALVFADFGGPRRSRALAYAAIVAIGGLLVALGSLLSGSLFGSAVAMFVIVFAVSFASVFGGYAPAFVAPLTLAYSLSVLSPLSDVAIDTRLLGWTIGGVAAMVAAVALWPVDQRLKLRQTLAKVSSALAKTLDSLHDPDAAESSFREASDAMAEAQRKASTPFRPAGPTSHHIGQLHLVGDLEQAVDTTRQLLDGGWTPREDEQLTAICARAFRQTNAILTEEISPDVVAEETERLDQAWLARRRMADAAGIKATAPHTEQSTAEALTEIRRSFPIMALSHIAIWVETDAATALGGKAALVPTKSVPELSPPTDHPVQIGRRAWRILSGGLDPDGVIFRNSVRAAAAMTLAVVVAQMVPVAHSFWVTLGALLVLRSSAALTSATALQAIAGTVVGFVIAAVVLWLFGSHDRVPWAVLPFAIFFAGYTPGAVSFMVGQVSFTVMIVTLFTLIENAGITTDIARLEAVSLGAVTGVLMALIFWPRGARAALARAVAAVYRAASEATRTLVTAPEELHKEARGRIHGARRRADEAFGVALNERGQAIDTRAWLALSRAPNLVDLLAGGLLRQPPARLFDQCSAAIESVAEQRDTVAGRLDEVAVRLDPAGADPARQPTAKQPANLQAKLLNCFELSRSHGPAGIDDALLLIAWSGHLTRVGTYIDQAEGQLDQVARASRPAAWLHWSAARTREGGGRNATRR